MHIFEGQKSRQKSTQGKLQRLPRLRKAHRDHQEPATDANNITDGRNLELAVDRQPGSPQGETRRERSACAPFALCALFEASEALKTQSD